MNEITMRKFWAKVVIDGECLTWTGGKNNGGYGNFHCAGRTRLAHRFAYEQLVGPISNGLVIDHLCRNRACVRPDHLEPVTERENILRGIGLAARNAVKTYCVNGHLFDEVNTFEQATGRGCRECGRKRSREHQARKSRAAGAGVAPSDRTHCPQGHPYAGDNLYRTPNGGRKCRECARERKRLSYAEVRNGAVDAPGAARTHCPAGHEYTEANTIRKPSGGRHCRECDRERCRRYAARQRAARAAS